MVSNRREEINKMFEEMGLGRAEDRERFEKMRTLPAAENDSNELTDEQLFILLDSNTCVVEEFQNGQLA